MNSFNYILEEVEESDLSAWLETKKVCYKAYVDQYYGGWVDEQQIELNTKTFRKACEMSYFRKIVSNAKTVGFLGYDEKENRIDGITIHMYDHARNHKIGSNFLQHITEQSNILHKPAYLKVFKTNPAYRLYLRFGFRPYDETDSHYMMKYCPSLSD